MFSYDLRKGDVDHKIHSMQRIRSMNILNQQNNKQLSFYNKGMKNKEDEQMSIQQSTGLDNDKSTQIKFMTCDIFPWLTENY